MARTGELIDFDIIEGHKENIAALPSGRSAKALARLYSPVDGVVSPAATQDLNAAARKGFEDEIKDSQESDDPLEVYDRYIKWTLEAYPSASGTPQSQLLPLLERATKTFIKDDHYKNDARYLKMWLHYIRLFSDSPRETYAYLARHDVASELALYYEEFAAWLESHGRWQQAQEIYERGIEKQARPVERLARKFLEFQRRAELRPDNSGEPTSPALPVARAALVSKTDPFSSSASPQDPQAAANARTNGQQSRKNKMQIFSDSSEEHQPSSSKGWESLGGLAERRKENSMAPAPWSGETLAVGSSRPAGAPKMAIFKDESSNANIQAVPRVPHTHEPRQTASVNPRAARAESVFVSLDLVYRANGLELSFEELRATSRGWLNKNWRKEVEPSRAPSQPKVKRTQEERTTTLMVPLRDENSAISHTEIQRDENERPMQRRRVREDRSNVTRVIRIEGDTQTGEKKLKRRKSAAVKNEPTMTVHTRAATDEVYALFEQANEESESEEESDAASESSDDDSDDEVESSIYTSGGESTTATVTGVSEAENTEEVDSDDEADPSEATNATNASVASQSENLAWTDYSGLQAPVPVAGDVEDPEEVATPTSPLPPNEVEQDEDVPRFGNGALRGRRLPFMTPIVERTESSLGSSTAAQTVNVDNADGETDYFGAKTPCPRADRKRLSLGDVWSSPAASERQDASEVAEEVLPEAKEVPAAGIALETPALEAPALEIPALETPAPEAPASELPAQDIPALETLSLKRPALETPAVETALEISTASGPVVSDLQCNPMLAETHNLILAHPHAAWLAKSTGFYDHRGQRCGKRGELQKFCRAQKASSRASHHGSAQLEQLTLELDGCKVSVRRELGAGAYAPVYLVERPNTGVLQALKLETPPSAWEFYMIECARRRLAECSARALGSIVEPAAVHVYDDESLLLEEYKDTGTLLDLVNIASEAARVAGAAGGGVDEAVAMFYVVELLRAVEALHASGLVHADLKADNVLVRAPADEPVEPYSADGAAGWAARGITLIDFGRSIDMRAFDPEVQFIADWQTSTADCAEMREARPWTYQVDYHGVAAIAHTLLFGRYMETARAPDSLDRAYRLREPLKRYWQAELWGELFAAMLNPARHAAGPKDAGAGGEPAGGEPAGGEPAPEPAELSGKMPLLCTMARIRARMEAWLAAHGESRPGGGLRAALRRVEAQLAARRR